MINPISIINEVCKSNCRNDKEQECMDLVQAAWMCLYRAYQISDNEEILKATEVIDVLAMKRLTKEDN